MVFQAVGVRPVIIVFISEFQVWKTWYAEAKEVEFQIYGSLTIE
jgi:hypothetical protein